MEQRISRKSLIKVPRCKLFALAVQHSLYWFVAPLVQRPRRWLTIEYIAVIAICIRLSHLNIGDHPIGGLAKKCKESRRRCLAVRTWKPLRRNVDATNAANSSLSATTSACG